ncbi:MAG: chemotaxis protein CheW [Planctomycetota bacterium]
MRVAPGCATSRGGCMEDTDDILAEFLVETLEGIDQLDRDLVTLEQEPGCKEVIAQIFRTVHTIKGSSSFLSLDRLGEVAHRGESLLSLLRDGRCDVTTEVTDALLGMADAIRAILGHVERDQNEGGEDHAELLATLKALVEDPPRLEAGAAAARSVGAGTSTVGAASSALRVDVGLLDQLMNLVGELVLARNQILQATDQLEDSGLLGTCQRLNLVTTELQEGVMKTRMQQVGSAWTKLPRVVRDLATGLGKRVELEMTGHETELDKAIIETIRDPLTHAVRNAVDHGIEDPASREAAGKSVAGHLRLRAFHEGGQVNIEISDDGRGIDPEKVRAKAVANGLLTMDAAATLSERETLQLIMQPGFSTAEQVTAVSGRGVGMDVVKTNIEAIGGTLDVHSSVGKGTTLRIKIPLTLAIVPALIVTSRGNRFAIPQANLLELVRLDASQSGRGVEYINGAPVHRLRGELLPLAHLDEELGWAGDGDGDGDGNAGCSNLVVLQADGRQFGLVVESILDTEEIVVKPLGRQLHGIRAFAGAAIMGDGRVALILDVLGLAQQTGLFGEGGASARQLVAEAEAVSRAKSSWLLLGVAGRRVALELSSVARLEELGADEVERAGGSEVLQYRGEIMPIVRVSRLFDDGAPADPARQLPLVVVRDHDGRSAGLAVDEILDIVEEDVEVGRSAGAPWLRGAATLQGRVTDLLDVDHLVALQHSSEVASVPSVAVEEVVR